MWRYKLSPFFYLQKLLPGCLSSSLVVITASLRNVKISSWINKLAGCTLKSSCYEETFPPLDLLCHSTVLSWHSGTTSFQRGMISPFLFLFCLTGPFHWKYWIYRWGFMCVCPYSAEHNRSTGSLELPWSVSPPGLPEMRETMEIICF